VRVTRPTRWGNPFKVVPGERTAEQAVAMYRRHLAEHPELVERARRELAGRDLACWCPPGATCHADVLLDVANAADPPGPDPDPERGPER